MKTSMLILLFFISTVVLSQKRVVEKFETESTEIEIFTLGLDDLIIENSTTGFVEVYLFTENIATQHIVYREEFGLIKITFEIPVNKPREVVFRKFITERLQRASVIVKIPKHKVITVFGEQINVDSKNYQGDLNFFIEVGILKLHSIYANLSVKMYAGNLYADLNKVNVDVVSRDGKVIVNDTVTNKSYQKKNEKSDKKVTINSLKANIFLTTQ